jgi:hypothetical protein
METEPITASFNQGAADAAQAPTKIPFKYGWCHTDHKSGRTIRQEYRTTDYLQDEPYASRVKAMLEQLGIPLPSSDEIFRGTHHDLLFLNSHGVVIRIGPLDIEDLLNPAILQPLGFQEDKKLMIEAGEKEVPLTVAIYPGIELYDDYRADDSKDKPKTVKISLRQFLSDTEQGSRDVGCDNSGIIRVQDDKGLEVALEVLLDPDNEFNPSSKELVQQRAASLREQQKHVTNRGEVISRTLQEVFAAAEGAEHWQRAFQLHQPLRQLFWSAFERVDTVSDLPDRARLDAFWDKCAQVTNRPEHTVLPSWHMRVDVEGNKVFIREEIPIPNLVLYRCWTGRTADKVTRPVVIADEVRKSVAAAHTMLTEKDRGPPLGLCDVL